MHVRRQPRRGADPQQQLLDTRGNAFPATLVLKDSDGAIVAEQVVSRAMVPHFTDVRGRFAPESASSIQLARSWSLSVSCFR